jgi:hypothetical protein
MALVILFATLHAICGLLTAIQLYCVAKEKRLSRYYTILAVNLLHQIVSVATVVVNYPNNSNKLWLVSLEILFSHQTVAMIMIINLSILQLFSFLFDFLQDWMLQTAFTAVYLYSGCLFAVNVLLVIGLEEMAPWIVMLSFYCIGFLSLAAVVHDNVQSILILNRVYTVSKQKKDKQTLQKVQKALVITTVGTVTIMVSDWWVIS